jgi:hypothetical protein
MTSLPVDPRPSITCPECGATSSHPQDVRQGYCPRCHWWTSDAVLGQCPPPGSTRPGTPACAGPVELSQPV